MTVPHDDFMQAIGQYEAAMRTRDSLDFIESVSMFEDAEKQMYPMDLPLPFRIAFTYDMALACDLAGQTDRARTLFQKSVEMYETLKLNSPQDQSVEDFEGLIWGISDYLSLWNNEAVPNDHYLEFIVPRKWKESKMPILVWIDRSSQSGFDDALRQIIWSGFKAWIAASDRLKLEQTTDHDNASIVVTRTDGLGSAGGHTRFEDATDASGAAQLHHATIRIALDSPDATIYSDQQLRALLSLCIHEAGHALGLDGHSPHATDVMYWKSPLTELSARDVATFRKLYS